MKTLYHIFTLVAILSIATFGQTQYSILIDPGHGGINPANGSADIGAPGTDGNGYPNERDITLKLGNDLRDYLTLYNITPNLRTYMTRKTDVYVSPENRAKMAKGEINDAYWVTLPKNGDGTKPGVDFFFSIHCNADGTTSHGTVGLIYDAVNDQTPSNTNTNDYKFAKTVVKEYVTSTKSVFIDASIRTSQYSPDGVGGRNNIAILNQTAGNQKNSFNLPRAVTILETEYASNPITWAWLQDGGYQSKAVEGMATGISNFKNIVVDVGPPGSPQVPGNFTASVSGQNVVLNWTIGSIWVWGHHVYKNGNLIAYLDAYTTSYTDVNAVNSLPAEYYVGAWNDHGESSTDRINIVGPTTITSSTTWSGIVQVDGTVIVNAGASLTINPGTLVLMKSGASIAAYGALIANGTIDNSIMIRSLNNSSNSPGSWGSIIFNGSGASNSLLNYCLVQYGYAIECHDGANATIENSTISNNYYGVLCYTSNPLISNNTIQNNTVHGIQCTMNSNPRIEGNIITKNDIYSGAGVYLYGASGYANSNTITGFSIGHYSTAGSSLGGWSGLDFYSTPTQNNIINSNMYGMATYDQSYIFMGWSYYPVVHGGNNWIESNVAYDLSTGSSTNMYAEGDWFGIDHTPTHVEGSNANLYWSALGNNPWGGSFAQRLNTIPDKNSSIVLSKGISIQPNDNAKGEDNLFNEAVSYYMNKSHVNAQQKFKQLLSSKKYSQSALIFLKYIFRDTKDEQVLSYIENLKKNPASYLYGESNLPLTTNILANMYGLQGEFTTSGALYDEVIKKYPNTLEERNARVQKLYYTVEGLKDKASAEQQLSELLTIYKDGDDIEMIKNLVNHSVLLYGSSRPTEGKSTLKGNGTNKRPTEFSLSTNYPNPFNPTTTIEYALPQPSQVTLKVFDVLGKEVATLVEGERGVGNYAVQFDASKLSSGLYIYRLQAGNYTSVKKMLLMR